MGPFIEKKAMAVVTAWCARLAASPNSGRYNPTTKFQAWYASIGTRMVSRTKVDSVYAPAKKL